MNPQTSQEPNQGQKPNQGQQAGRGMIPSPPLPPGLTRPPFAVSTFTDLRRGKGFLALHYRVRRVTREIALAFIGDVLADLESAGVPHRGAVTISLTPAEGEWTAYLKVPIETRGDLKAPTETQGG